MNLIGFSCVLIDHTASIMQGSNGLQPAINAIKIEAPSYYCNSYTPPAPDHSTAMLHQAGAYSELANRLHACTRRVGRDFASLTLTVVNQVRSLCTGTRRVRSIRAGTSVSGG